MNLILLSIVIEDVINGGL